MNKDIKQVIKAACIVTGCTIASYNSRCGKEECALARHLVVWYRKVYLGETYAQIGGNHSTHIYAVNRIKDILSLKKHAHRDKILQFLAMCETNHTPELRSRAFGSTLMITGTDRAAVFNDGLLTVMSLTGEVWSQKTKPDMTVDELIEQIQR